MIKVAYDPVNGLVWPDAEIASVVSTFINEHKESPSVQFTIVVGSEMVIHEFRCNVATKVITPDEIEIQFNGNKLSMDQRGRIDHWPTGFCDVYNRQLGTLVNV